MADTAQDTADMDEGNVLKQVSNRFLRMVATPPKVIEKQVMEWTSVQNPSEGHVKVALASVHVPEILHKGIPVTKVSSYGKFHKRIVTVSRDKFAIFVTHQRIHGNALAHMGRKLPLPLVSRKGIRGFQSRELREQYVRYIDVADLQGTQVGVVDTQKLELSRECARTKGCEKSTVDKNHADIVTIFHHGNRALDVLVEDATAREALVTTIQQLQETYRRVMEHVVPEARLLRYVWYDLDQNRDGRLDPKEFARLLNRINLFVKYPKHMYTDFQKEQHIRGNLTYRQCMDLLTHYCQGKIDSSQVDMGVTIFERVFGTDDNYVSAQVFLDKFLHQHQHETDVTKQHVVALFGSINTMELNQDESSLPIKEGYLSKHRFACYLHHSINDAYNPDSLHIQPTTTLDKPMSQYWINTSHNTYLTGDQLQSTSSVEMYVNALRRGCKCLELDCWDGETKEEDGTPIPVVFHGHTLTTKILFGDVLNCVQAYVQAHPETYPIILSLENHCSKPYQQVIATLLKETLGEHLYIPAKGDTKNGDLPSPQFLKGKVVIKGKRPPEPDDAPVGNMTEPGSTPNRDEEDDPYNVDTSSGGIKKTMSGNDAGAATTTSGAAGAADSHSSTILPELAALTLFHGTKYRSFEDSIHSPPSHMHSIGETKITKIVSQGPDRSGLWRMYNLHHMTRTYPAGSRVDSSNYNPVLAWAMGCQMVALNFQTSDTPLMLNDGRFRQNGGCGYVLKPKSILEMKERSETKTLKVRVMSGTCLPKPDGDTVGETIDPYVMVTVHDVVTTADGIQGYKASSHSTATIADNGFRPVWNEKDFYEFTVEFPEVAMVQFNLMEADVTLDDKVADASIPFSCLRRGYRSIQLYDRNNTRTGPFSMASLLVEIDYE